MAAQGLLPLKPEDLVDLWATVLVNDRDEAVKEAAAGSLTGFEMDQFLPIVKSRSTPEKVLAWVAEHRVERELREAALQNVSLADESIEKLAPTLPQELAELVVINQVRLLRRTSLLEAIESNAGLSNDQKRRLMELRQTFKIGVVDTPPAPKTEVPRPPEPEPAPEPEPEPEPALSEDEAMVRYLSEQERDQAEKVSAVQKIYRLNTAEKMITALKGTREERAILIRDPNRLVSSSVLSSPKVTEAEIESFSAMKNVSDQVLRAIGNNREATKSYVVVNNLVRNPRTPIGVALNLVPRLNPRDLKGIVVDRNVPEAVRKQAQKFMKGPGGSSPGGKH